MKKFWWEKPSAVQFVFMFIKLLAACAMPHIPKKTLIAHLTMGIGKRRRALAPYMQPLKEVNWAEVDREPPFVLV